MDGRVRVTRADLRLPAAVGSRERGASGPLARLPHVHRFRWAGEDPFSPHNLYACRCGVVRAGL
jgi:hypothetical protein